MNYLIDGHNLIAKMPDLSLADPDDEAQLVRRLQMWAAARRKRRVMVIFDKGVVAGKSAQLSNNQVQVYFAPASQTADSLLVRHIARVQNPAEHTLISSDRAVMAAAEARGMRAIFAEVFAAQMEEERQPPPPAPTEPALSDAEIAEWLDLFGPVPERPPAPPRLSPRPAAPPPTIAPQPPPRVYSPEEYKAGLAHMSPEELADWLVLFGPEPAPAPSNAAPAEAPPPVRRQPAERGRNLAVEDERKEGRARLTPEEIELWLEQFGGEDPRPQG